MDEVTWRTTATQRMWMLEHLRGKSLPRRMRLFACACVRRVWQGLPSQGCRAVEVAERFADGQATETELAGACGGAAGANSGVDSHLLRSAYFAAASAQQACLHAAAHALAAVPHERWREELAAQCDLIRCIFGNPFRPVVLSSSVREATAVRHIAQVIETERRWADLPILADALEDAGCVDEDALTHCRRVGPHGRGCWVVDQILGRGP